MLRSHAGQAREMQQLYSISGHLLAGVARTAHAVVTQPSEQITAQMRNSADRPVTSSTGLQQTLRSGALWRASSNNEHSALWTRCGSHLNKPCAFIHRCLLGPAHS